MGISRIAVSPIFFALGERYFVSVLTSAFVSVLTSGVALVSAGLSVLVSDAVLGSEVTALDVLFLLSVMYHPEPLNMIPAGCNIL